MMTTKRIVIRIIVAVAVAIILSKLKLLNIIEVSALEVWNTTARDFCVYSTPSSSPVCDTNLVDRTYFGRSWRSYTYSSSATFDLVSFNIPQTNMANRKFHYSVAFMLWSGNTNDSSFPVRAYLNDGTNNSACSVEGGNFGDVGYSKVYIISCKDAFQGQGSSRLFITGPFETANTLFALSTGTMIWDNDEVIALQTQNNYLQQIRNSLNDTNNKLQTMIDLQNQNNQTQTQIQNNTKETNDLIKSDDTTESNAKGKEFFDNFENDSHGLSGIITAPFRLLNSLTTQGCSPLNFDLPFDLGHVSLPCMRGIYEQHFGIFFSLWQMITTGLISYNVILNIYSKVRSMQNPYNDRIEVLNL